MIMHFNNFTTLKTVVLFTLVYTRTWGLDKKVGINKN